MIDVSTEEMPVAELSADEAEQQYPGPKGFTPLHVHSIFSALDGIASPADYFKACAERKWPALAISEHGVLSSIPDAYFAAKETGVKYLVANEFYYNDYEQLRRKMTGEEKTIGELRKENQELAQRITRNRHLTVICKNTQGYENLLKLNRWAYEYGFYYKPRICFDELVKHKEGLIILSGCLNGPISFELQKNIYSPTEHTIGAIEYAKRFKREFGDDFYIELQMPCLEDDINVFQQLVAIAENLDIKCVITNDSHYLYRRDFEIQRIMMAIDQGLTVNDPELFYVNSNEQYFKTRAELRATFYRKGYSVHVPVAVFEQACDNTLEIAERCHTFTPNLEPKLPKIENADEKLCDLATQGLIKRGLHKDHKKYLVDGQEVTHQEQLAIELQRLIEKGFASYFLITKDLIDCCPYPIGPARGSAGGSLVCFLIGVQAFNPLLWGLSFNRFLSPSRGGYMLNINMK